jgi:acylphosphatase
MATTPAGGPIRFHIIYRGRVQGVCFRANAQEIARLKAVTGLVRNLPDGTVELEVQGTPRHVADYLNELAARFAGYIAKADKTTIPVREEERGFEIAY